MKKLLVVLLVLGLIVPVAATAEERLSMSGAMRVRAFDFNNVTDMGIDGVLTEGSTAGGADQNDADHLQYWDQRFRVQTVITPADGVKAVLRTDFSETTWGTGGLNGGVRPGITGNVTDGYSANNIIQVDRAYLDVTKGIVNVKAGQQHIGLGNNFAYDNNATGLQVTIKTPVTIRLGMVKETERTQTAFNTTANSGAGEAQSFVNDEEGAEDVDDYLIDLGFKNDMLGINVFYVMRSDGLSRSASVSTQEPTMMGAMATFGIGPVNVFTELNMFGGDSGTSGNEVNYVGIQWVAQGTMKMSDALTLGAHLIYSDGTNKADEVKTCRFPGANFGSTYYSDFGPFNTFFAMIGAGDVFDPKDTGAGAMGAGVFTTFAPMPDLTVYGALHYLTGVEDDLALYFDSAIDFNIGVKYTLVPGCHISLAYNYIDAQVGTNVAGASDPDTSAMSALGALMQVSF